MRDPILDKTPMQWGTEYRDDASNIQKGDGPNSQTDEEGDSNDPMRMLEVAENDFAQHLEDVDDDGSGTDEDQCPFLECPCGELYERDSYCPSCIRP